jgi:UDP-2-acetamido-2-deoxy-ribo-hexuluronate aminotransferase
MIPFVDLAAQQDRLRVDIEAGIARVLAHGKYILGPEVDELEEKLAAFAGAKHCISCANGTDALQIAFMALDLQPGDEIITPAFSYIATAEAAVLLGLKPIYVDIDPATYCMDPALVEEVITERTKVILPVSLYGQVADFDAINAIAHEVRLESDRGCGAEFWRLLQRSQILQRLGHCLHQFFPLQAAGLLW